MGSVDEPWIAFATPAFRRASPTSSSISSSSSRIGFELLFETLGRLVCSLDEVLLRVQLFPQLSRGLRRLVDRHSQSV